MRTSSKKNRKKIETSGKFDWRYLLFFLSGFFVAALFFILTGNNHASVRPAGKREGGNSPSSWQKWEYAIIKLQRPDDTFPNQDIKPMPIVWYFAQQSPEEVEQIIKSCDLDPVLEKTLLDKNRWKQEGGRVALTVPAEAVRNLPIEARKKIYSILKKDPSNFFHFNPFRVPVNELDEWLATSGLSPENQRIFREVSWQEGDTIFFYDYQLFEHIITNPQEKKSVAKALSQVPALLMNLKVTPETDVDAVVKYFEPGGRGREMKPFLESLKRLPEGRQVNVAFFLPTFARLRLYTYPKFEAGRKPYDCFYSAMNFFNEVPDERFLDANFIQQTLQTHYYIVGTNYSFGDLIMLLEDGVKAIHMCVYIADGVVFTKNGGHDLQPWILMRLQDMLKIYQTDRRLTTIVYRRKH